MRSWSTYFAKLLEVFLQVLITAVGAKSSDKDPFYLHERTREDGGLCGSVLVGVTVWMGERKCTMEINTIFARRNIYLALQNVTVTFRKQVIQIGVKATAQPSSHEVQISSL